MSNLFMISPIDGRYRNHAEPLAEFFSEQALMKYRIQVESEYLIALSETEGVSLRQFTEEEKQFIRNLTSLGPEDAQTISDIETKGYGDIKATDHDVKAAEYYMKLRLDETSLGQVKEWLHFALTSEDTNNLAYALMLSDALEQVIVPALKSVEVAIEILAQKHKNLPMLARTHGQPASPSTFGKEFKIFSARLSRQINQLEQRTISAKLNGATGNYNAHQVAFPKIDWPKFTEDFLSILNKNRKIKLEPNLFTAQIEPHDGYAELFDNLRRANSVLIDFTQDIWRYISDEWIGQKAVEGTVGSSTMPHKVNPIKFENGEGNLGLANALLHYFSTKLPISRLQRDLSDSTVERNFGTALAHGLLAYKNISLGLENVSVNEEKVKAALMAHPEVITEAIQTILRREGVPMPYEQLKALTRGRQITTEDIKNFINHLDVTEELKQELLAITPENYIGLAEKLTESGNT